MVGHNGSMAVTGCENTDFVLMIEPDAIGFAVLRRHSVGSSTAVAGLPTHGIYQHVLLGCLSRHLLQLCLSCFMKVDQLDQTFELQIITFLEYFMLDV